MRMALGYQQTNKPAGKLPVEEEEEQEGSSLQKTIGNVLNLVNDGLYRFKNRAKSELVSLQVSHLFVSRLSAPTNLIVN